MARAQLAYVNVLTGDPERLAGFYATLIGLEEIAGHRSPIYRCLDAGGGLELGFNADAAYDLLGLADRRPAGMAPICTYLTFEVDAADTVDALAAKAEQLGGRVIKAPYLTYYNARQAVLADPDGNVFRLNCRLGPRTAASEVENPPW